MQRPEDVDETARDAALADVYAAHPPAPEASVYEIVTRVDRSNGGQAPPRLIRGPGAGAAFEALEHGKRRPSRNLACWSWLC